MARVALVGVGRWGKNLLRILAERSEVTRCCNRSNHEVHRWLAQHYPHIPRTFDYDEVLQDDGTDAVIIATPIQTHAELTRRALEANKHVFVEKPLATTVAEARELAEAADRRGRCLFVGHVFLYHPVLEKLRELTRADAVQFIKMTWMKPGTFEEHLYWNLLSHEVSIACTLFQGRPRHVAVLHQQGVVTACDLVTARLQFAEGRECIIEVNRCAPTKRKSLTLVTASGKVWMWQDDALYALQDRQRVTLVYESREEALTRELEAFLSSVDSGTPVSGGGVLGCLVVEVVTQLLDANPRAGEG